MAAGGVAGRMCAANRSRNGIVWLGIARAAFLGRHDGRVCGGQRRLSAFYPLYFAQGILPTCWSIAFITISILKELRPDLTGPGAFAHPGFRSMGMMR